MIGAGAGLPFFLMAFWGGALSSAAFVGALIPGTAPVLIFVFAVMRGRFEWRISEFCGIACILCGIAGLLWQPLLTADKTLLAGALILVIASTMWSVYSMALRETDVDAVGCTLLINIPSGIVSLALLATGILPGAISHVFTLDAVIFVVAQGLGVGVVASVTYRYSIRALGAQRSSILGSLSPAATTLLALPLLNETPTLSVVIGIALIMTGVATSGIPSRSQASRRRPDS
jgi:drug/metabolite transporter (DMT)-like permease